MQFFKWLFRVIGGLFLLLSLVISAGITFKIVDKQLKEIDKSKIRGIDLDLLSIFSSVIAILSVVAVSAPSVSSSFDKIDEWGHKLDNKIRKRLFKKEYYLDKASQLRKEATKLKHSAQDNCTEIVADYRGIKKNFPTINKTRQNILNSEDLDTVLDEIELFLDLCLMWLFKLDFSEGDVNSEKLISYYSASQKLAISVAKLNIARNLLATHKPPVSNFKIKHEKLGDIIAIDKNHIIEIQNSIRKTKRDIVKSYIEIYRSRILVRNFLKLNKVTLSQDLENLVREVRFGSLGMVDESVIEVDSLMLGGSEFEKKEPEYKTRTERDSLLSTDLENDYSNLCVVFIGQELVKDVCCPFFEKVKSRELKKTTDLKREGKLNQSYDIRDNPKDNLRDQIIEDRDEITEDSDTKTLIDRNASVTSEYKESSLSFFGSLLKRVNLNDKTNRVEV